MLVHCLYYTVSFVSVHRFDNFSVSHNYDTFWLNIGLFVVVVFFFFIALFCLAFIDSKTSVFHMFMTHTG